MKTHASRVKQAMMYLSLASEKTSKAFIAFTAAVNKFRQIQVNRSNRRHQGIKRIIKRVRKSK